MSTIVSWTGSSFTVPETGEEYWGGVTKVDGLLVSLATNGFQKTGGNFTLSADVDFGGTAGLKAGYYKSRSATISTAGVIRLARSETVSWRNQADGADLPLGPDSSNNLTYNGAIIASSSGVVPVGSGGTGIMSYTTGDILYASGVATLSKLAIGAANTVLTSSGAAPAWAQIVNANVDNAAALAYSKLTLTGGIVNADISSSAGIVYSKLNLTGLIVNADLSAAAAIARSKVASGTASHVLINDGSGNLSSEAALALTRGGTGQATAALAYDALALTTTKGDLAVRSATAAARLAVGTDGQVLTADAAQTLGVKWSTPTSAPDGCAMYTNGSIAASVAASALTIALKDKSGSDASGGSVVSIGMRSSTATTGTYNYRTISAALSLVINSGTKLGTANGTQFYGYVYLIDSDGAGTMKLGFSTAIYDEGSLQSTVAESVVGTVTIASPGVWTSNGHGLGNGDAVTFTTTGALPTGLTAGTSYYVINTAANTFQVAATMGGAAINTSGSQSGVHTIRVNCGRLVSDGVYASKPVRLIERLSLTEATAGTWATAPSELSNIPFKNQKFYVYGATQTVNGTLTSASFGTPTNTIAVEFVAPKTGLYRIETTNLISYNSTSGQTVNHRIVNTVGSGTAIVIGQNAFDTTTGFMTSQQNTMSLFGLYELTASVSYRFELQVQSTSGQVTVAFGSLNGKMIASEY